MESNDTLDISSCEDIPESRVRTLARKNNLVLFCHGKQLVSAGGLTFCSSVGIKPPSKTDGPASVVQHEIVWSLPGWLRFDHWITAIDAPPFRPLVNKN